LRRLVIMFASLILAAALSASAPPPDPRADPPLVWDLKSVRRLNVQLPGLSHHFSKPTERNGMEGRRYNEHHWGIGLEFEDPAPTTPGDGRPWITRTSFGLIKDSLDAMGLYAGRTIQRRVLDKAAFSVDVGAGAFLFLRTMQFDGPHRLVPAVLPVISVSHKPTRLGVNAVLVPEFTIKGNKMPGVFFLQFTYGF
jgi:hypothetical protein